MRKLFHLPGSCSAAMVLGYLSGYPVGAGIVAQLYARGSCSKSQAERLLAMCNNSGPAFILGVVGAKLFGSAAIGGIIYICHVLSSLAVCFVFRGRSEPCSPLTADHEKNQNFAQAFTASIKSSLVTVGSICGFVVFFRVIVKVMEITGIFRLLSFLPSKLLALSGIDSTIASALTSGIFELSTGICAIDISAGPIPAMACAAFLLGWAGISVHFQVLSLISGSGLSIKKYLAGKLLHAVFATFFTAVAGIIFFQSAPTFSVPGYQVVSYISLFFICSAAAAAVFMAFLFFAAKAVKKHRNS
jgi:sporulation integral membrane protein YlbJ